MGILLVFDYGNKASFENCRYWINEIFNHCNKNIKILLVANKVDLVDKSVFENNSDQNFEENDYKNERVKNESHKNVSLQNGSLKNENNKNRSFGHIDNLQNESYLKNKNKFVQKNFVDNKVIKEFVDEYGLMFINTSALNNYNVFEAYKMILEDIDKDFKGEMRQTFSLLEHRYDFDKEEKKKML